jgi:integrase
MATICERKNDDGEVIGFQVKVRRRGYPAQSKTFYRKGDAERWARKVEREMDDGVFVDRSAAQSTTLAALLLKYVAEVTPGHKGADQEAVRLRQMARSQLARYSAANVKAADFVQWRDERLTQVSPSTVIRELNCWHAVIEHARKEWAVHIHENPVHLVKRPTPAAARERRLEPLGDGMTEADWLLAAADTCGDPWMRPLITVAIETGMRQGEMLALRWADIDVRKATARLLDTKNGEARTVPLSSRAIATLEALPRHVGGLVFPISANPLKMRYRRMVERAGIPDLTFHDLRHEATSRLFERGLDMMEVASITGHKTMAMLRRYTHLAATNLAKKLG